MRSPVDLAATALHEAGHATAELVLRPKRTFVAEIYPDPKGRFAGQVRHPDSPGDCEHDVEVEESSRLFVPDFAADHDKADEIDGYLIRSGVTYYAGCAAQLFDSRGLTAELVRCSYYDRMRVSDAALGMGRDLQPGQFWWRAFDRACDLIL